MISRDLSFLSPQENIVYDEVLLHLAEKGCGGEVLRFWESSQMFVVLGRIGKVQEDVNVDEVLKNNIPILRRCSGGGTVLQGKGCLNYSLVMSKQRHVDIDDLKKSYHFILSRVVKVLSNLSVKTCFHPISDIALLRNQKKISGNAQKRGRHFILHHGTLLYDFHLDDVSRYLKFPKVIPEYRQKREHLDFVDNLNLRAKDIKSEFHKIFSITKEDSHISSEERLCLDEFLLKKKTVVSLD